MGLQDTHDVVTSGISALPTLGAAISAGWDYFGPNNKKRADNMAIAVDRIHNCTLALNEALAGTKLLKRDCFDDFNAKASLARADDQNPSLLVYGARGVGKTTVVRAAMQVNFFKVFSHRHAKSAIGLRDDDAYVCTDTAMDLSVLT
jgi:hypothetical protein